MAENSTSQQPPRRPQPNLLACIACRRAHMKCTGNGKSTCERCLEKNAKCVWVESRRGYKPPKQASAAASDSSQSTPSSKQRLQPKPHDVVPTRSDNMMAIQGGFIDSYEHEGCFLPSPDSSTQSSLLQTREPKSPSAYGPDVLLDLFYKYFYPSHPFVLPQKMRDRSPDFLKSVMRFGGSHFVPHGAREMLKDAAISQLTLSAPENGFKVQAFALLAMISFSRNEHEEGQAYLHRAIDLSLVLGLNKAEFALRFGKNDPIVEESWRRTWWDLFIVEGLISSFTGRLDSSKFRGIATDVSLPGHCEAYDACSPFIQLRSYEEMQERAFSDEEFQWSSFAYKIEAINVSMVDADSFGTTNSQVEILDQRLSNFHLSLPAHKREALKPTGEVDEVIFGALMIANCAEINLHRPRSSLIYIQNHYHTVCTPEAKQGLTAIEYRSHDAKAIRAANAITNLLTVPSAPIQHTPCFTCALTLATTVQLPAMALKAEEGTGLKERIQLAITAMGSISEVWPMALATKSQVAHFAREIMKSTKEGTNSNTSSSLPSPSATQPQILRAPPTEQPDFEDFLVTNQDWLMDLIHGDGGLTLPESEEVEAWLQDPSHG